MHKLIENLDSWHGRTDSTRPRCFPSSDETQRLRAEARSGGSFWTTLRARALERARQSERPLEREEEPEGGALELAFAHWLWPARELLAAVLDRVDALMATNCWVWHKGNTIDLRSSMVASSLAMIYDLLYDDLNPRERSAILSSLGQRDLGAYAAIAASRSEWWTNCRMNWQSVIHGHMGIAALACGGDLPDWRRILRLACEGVLDYLDALPEDGSYREGLQYWHFGVGEAAWFASLLRLASGCHVNLFEHPYFNKTLDFAWHMSTPDGCFDFEDCYSFRAEDWLTSILRKHSAGPSPGGPAAPFDPLKKPFRKLGAPGLAMRYALAGEPVGRPETAPEPPRSRYFNGCQTVCMRSDWGPDATFVAFHAGRVAMSHAHQDAGSFVIGSRGRRVVPDAGFWPYSQGFFDYEDRRWNFDGASAVGHSVLLIDNEGPGHGKASEALLSSVTLRGDSDRIVCDLTPAYLDRVLSCYRYFIFVRPDLVFILDDVTSNRPRQYKWNIQTAGSVELGNPFCRIRNASAAADVHFCNLNRSAGYRFTSETRISHYEPFSDAARESPVVKSISVGTIHPASTWLTGAVFVIGDPVPAAEVSFSHSTSESRFHCALLSKTVEIAIDRERKEIASVALRDRVLPAPEASHARTEQRF